MSNNGSSISEFVRNAAVFVLTSDFEGIPNALVEVISSGIPGILTDYCLRGVELLIKNGVYDLFVKKGTRMTSQSQWHATLLI